MYLSNNELSALIEKLNFTVRDPKYPFDPEKQIQLCSIDLRLSNVFWKPKTLGQPIDLRQGRLYDISPRRQWERVNLDYDGYHTLKPGEFILGQTFERFCIPKTHAGKVETRSSFARLGISTNSATDFMNPGWCGYLPLEIINHSPFEVRIFPLLGIAQLMLVPLSSVPKGEYGSESHASTYQDDDGGPSFWWRDGLFKRIQSSYAARLSDQTLNALIERFKTVDDDGLNRLHVLISKLPGEKLGSAEDILGAFQSSEKSKARSVRIFRYVLGIFTTCMLGLSAKNLLSETPYCSAPLYLVTTALICWAVYELAFKETTKFYYEPSAKP